MSAIARDLGISVNAVRAHYSKIELAGWRRSSMYQRQKDRMEMAIKVVRSRLLELGRVPTYEESGLAPKTIQRCGGYPAIIKAAGYAQRGVRMRGKKVLTPKPPTVTRVKHWQEVKKA
jgi:hypothetical protein